MSEALENLLSEDRKFPPPPEFTAQANAKPGIHESASADYLSFWQEQALDRYLAKGPPSSEAARARGVARAKLGNHDGAIEDYANERALTPKEVATWQVSVKRTREWLRARGIAHVFTIAPDKHVIYPEYFPSSVPRLGTVSI